MEKFSWETFKSGYVMVECAGPEIIRDFIMSAENHGIEAGAIRSKLAEETQVILIRCIKLSTLSGRVLYIAEPARMFTTEDSPWLVDWDADVIMPQVRKARERLAACVSTERYDEPRKREEESAFDILNRRIKSMGPNERIAAFGKPYADPIHELGYDATCRLYVQWVDRNQKTGDTGATGWCPKEYVPEENYLGSNIPEIHVLRSRDYTCEDNSKEVWELTQKITAMTDEERVTAFGAGCNPLLSMTYSEAKRRYDAWDEKIFRPKDIVFLPSGRRAAIIGKPVFRPNGEKCHMVLFTDYSTAICRDADLVKSGKQAESF